MKTLYTVLLLTVMTLPAFASDGNLEKYISEFGYFERIGMKINSQELIDLLEEGKAQLIDIRFKEEYSAWNVQPSVSIPLNELPQRLKDIDTNKVVVTAILKSVNK